MRRLSNYIERLKARIALHPKSFRVYSILRIFVILTAIRCFFVHNYENLALCILSLILFLLPSVFEEKLKIEIPATFQIIIYCFIYAAEILGEVDKFYTNIPHWDTMLHTMNGFLCAAIGFSLVGILNRGSKHMHLSPFYLTLVAFCFSMTIGVLWEFFEFSADQFFYVDMQKDFIVQDIGSVTLDESHSQIPVHLSKITKTDIVLSDGSVVTVDGGYLDIGIIDTMKDLIVNFIGAVVFSIFGYAYLKNREKNVASDMMILPLTDEEIKAQIVQMQAALEANNKKMGLKKNRQKEAKDIKNR